jgi:hypothetical protein
MLLQVLGPIEARSARGHVIRLRPREKAVLGYLLLNAGQPCSADVLIQDVWGDDLPADPGNTLRLVISRIRQAFKPETIITTIGSGAYQADPAPGVLDMQVFQALLADAWLWRSYLAPSRRLDAAPSGCGFAVVWRLGLAPPGRGSRSRRSRCSG